MSNQIKNNFSLNNYLPTNFRHFSLFLKLKIKNLFFFNLSRFNKNYLLAFVVSNIIHYPTPITFTYAWSFWSLEGICLIIQMLSGIFLSMHYTPNIDLAFLSVEYIMRDVPNDWLIRYIHANGASMFFIVGFANICRKLYYSFMARWLFSINHKDIGTLSLQILRILSKSGTRLFSINVPDQSQKGPRKSLKNHVFDMFLKYQYNMCVKSDAPLSHLMLVSVLTYIFSSYRYIILYWVSIIFILISLYLLENFPNSFGKRYIKFLKINSSTDAFNKYFGNQASSIKGFLSNPEWLKIVFKNGAAKGAAVISTALATEHICHHAKFGQLYEYTLDKHMNNGVHSSGKPFSFQPNGPSMLDQWTGRKMSWKSDK